jgi:hypothetical protein
LHERCARASESFDVPDQLFLARTAEHPQHQRVTGGEQYVEVAEERDQCDSHRDHQPPGALIDDEVGVSEEVDIGAAVGTGDAERDEEEQAERFGAEQDHGQQAQDYVAEQCSGLSPRSGFGEPNAEPVVSLLANETDMS